MKTILAISLTALSLFSSAQATAEEKEKFKCDCYANGEYNPETQDHWNKVGSITIMATIDTAAWDGRRICVKKYRKLNAVAVCEFAD